MSLLFNKKDILVVNRRLAALVGLNEAIVLQQIHYWIEKKAVGVDYQGCRWVFNSLAGWHEQFPFWSQDTIKRALQALRAAGLVRAEKLSDVGRDRTNYYTIDYKQLALLEARNLPSCIGADCTNGSGQSAPMDQGNLHQSIGADCTNANKTKITTKTTTKTTSGQAAASPPPKPAQPAAPAKAKPKTGDESALQAACRATWAAYGEAYERRYGAAPVRNASVNARIRQFVGRIGYDESPAVAAFFVASINDAFVQRKLHDVGLLLSGAEGYRTQWVAGRAIVPLAGAVNRQEAQEARNRAVGEQWLRDMQAQQTEESSHA